MSTQPGTNASDQLWTTVMQNEIDAHGNPQGKKWRTVRKDVPACDSCKDSGVIVLLRCGHDKCPREYHVDCAFHQGGLTLDDNGVFTVFCDAHFKPLVFCSCKEAYEESRPMVYCDECCDWFHNSCEGMSATAPQADTYTCKNCRDNMKHGRSVSKTVKEKNMNKEQRSMHQQNARKAIGLLCELEGGLCPIIDEIARVGKSQFFIKDIQDAKEILSAPPFMVKRGMTSMDDAEAQNAELLTSLGVMSVVEKWRGELNDYLGKYQAWQRSAQQAFEQTQTQLRMEFDSAQMSTAAAVASRVSELAQQAKAALVGTPQDFEAYLAYKDCVQWIFDFLQLLHQSPKAENWSHAIGSSLRTGAGCYKHLAAVSKDHFCGAFLDFLQSYHVHASQHLNTMNAWYKETYKILSVDMEYQLEGLDTFLKRADEFPARPLLYEELRDIVQDAWQLQEQIDTALAAPALSEEALQELNTKKSELGVSLPSEQKLGAVSERMIFLKACRIALTEEQRLQNEVAQSLIAQSHNLYQNTFDSSPLYVQLGFDIQEAVGQLQGLLDEAAAVVTSLGGAALTMAGADLSVLPQLRALRVITTEEELLEFVQRADMLHGEAENCIPVQGSDEQPTGMTAVLQLVERIEATLRSPVSDRFEVAQERKASLSRQLSSLQDQQSHSERLWGVVLSGIADCERGSPVSAEELRAAIIAADATRIRDTALFRRAEDLLDIAATEAGTCLRQIESVQDASEESVKTTRAMVERIQHYPVAAESSRQIVQRAKVCAAVFESHRFLETLQGAEPKVVLDRDMHALRELSATIAKLAATTLLEPEFSLVAGVKDDIFRLHWRAEVWFMAQHAITPVVADALKKQGEELTGGAQDTREWADLLAEMQRASAFADEASAALKASAIKDTYNQTSDPSQWYSDCVVLELRLKDLIEQDSVLHIKLQATSQALVESFELLSSVRSAHTKIEEVHRAMKAAGTSAPAVDFRDITALTNHLTLAGEKHPSFQLLAALRTEMNQIHSAAAQWSETANNLLPQKATRNKTKAESAQPTLESVLSALAEPIARAVVTPMHERFFRVLQDVDLFRVGLMSFLLPLNSPIKDTSNYQSPEFLEKLQADLGLIKDMKKQAEAIPLDLPEFKVLSWIGDLFEWIHSIPYPGDDPKQHAIPMDMALRLVESQPMNIAGEVVQTLCRLGAMNIDSNADHQFHSNIHPNFNLAGDLSVHLEQQIKRTEEVSQRISKATETPSESHRHTAELLKLSDEVTGLLVEPTPQVRRALEKSVGKTLSKATGRSSLDEMSEGESSEYSLDGDEDETDNYWTERVEKQEVSPRPRAAVTKRSRGEDSLVGVPSAKKAATEGKVKLEDKGVAKKGRSAACANPNCPTSSNKLRNSIYCSNQCAMVTAPAMFDAMLSYRKLLCIHGCVKRHLVRVDDPTLNLRKVSDADWNAFFVNSLPAKEAVLEIVAGMKSAGFVSESKHTGRPSDALDAFLQDGERRVQSLEKSSTPVAAEFVPSADKKTSYIQNILSALPPAAGPVLLRGDNDGVTAHTAAVKAAGSTPVPTISSSASGNNSGSVDEDMRLKIRYGLEELLERTLSRLQVPGAVNHAAIIALDFEDELCLKYATAESKAAKKALVFDKKEYRKHYLMLVSNLRKPHNDQLILKLVTNEISVEALLEMTAVQLADTSTQQRRQQQLSNVVQDALRESTQETLEAARRSVMAGGDIDPSDFSQAQAQTAVKDTLETIDTFRTSLARESSMEMEHAQAQAPTSPSESSSRIDVSTDSWDGDEGIGGLEQVPTTSSRSLEIEQMVSLSTSPRNAGGNSSKPPSSGVPKRPIDADAISRFTTYTHNRPAKLQRLDTGESVEASEGTPRSGLPKESPRVKPASLLGNILANKAALEAAASTPKDSANAVHFDDLSSASHRMSGSSKRTANASAVKLINSQGGNELSIVRPAHGSGNKNIVMKGEAWVIDRQLQGIAKSPCNVDGRVKLEEFVRIINKVLTILNDSRPAPNKKLVTVFKMSVTGAAKAGSEAAENYEQFCTEFTRDQRVALSNLGGGSAQLYVLPPALRDCLPIFACLEDVQASGSSEDAILYGVLTSKDMGPDCYVSAGSGFTPGGFSLDDPSYSAASSRSSAVPPPVAPSGSKSQAKSASSSSSVPPPPAPPSTSAAVKAPPAAVAPPPRPAVPPPKPPVVVSAPSTSVSAGTSAAASSVPPPAAPSKPVEDPIQRVASFCAARGVQMIRDLQAKPETRSVMPFLFEGHPDNPKFLAALKDALAQRK